MSRMSRILYRLGFWVKEYVDFNGPKPYHKHSRFAWWKSQHLRRQHYRTYP